MKQLYKILLSACLLIFAVSGVAVANENSTLKVGVLDWQQLFTKAPQAEEAGKRLEKEFSVQKEKFLDLQKKFQSKQEKLQRDRDVMSEAERTKSEKELIKLQQDLKHMDEELRSDYSTRHQEEMNDFINTVRDVVSKLATEEKYDLVLPQEATVFIAERVDVTEKVLQRLAKAKTTSKASEKSTKDKEKDKK